MNDRYEQKFTKAKPKYIGSEKQKKSKEPIENKSKMPFGVTQANGLENEIVKILESRIANDQTVNQSSK